MPPSLDPRRAHRGSVSPQRAVAAFDSASAFLESLSRALAHREFAYLGQSRAKVPLVHASRLLPVGLRRRAYAWASGREGVAPDQLGRIDMGQVAAWAVGKYDQSPRPTTASDADGRPGFPAVLIGSSNGALTHLAAACGIPWLPQTLLIPVRRPGADPTDYRAAADFGRQHATTLLDHNPGISLHHMHDANQDELSASQMAYFRVKWRELPEAYRHFLDQRLLPGAPLIVTHDTSTWPVTRYGERHVFQAGAQGGMNAENYHALPGVPAPDTTTAEAEWGLDETHLEPLRDWPGLRTPRDRDLLRPSPAPGRRGRRHHALLAAPPGTTREPAPGQLVHRPRPLAHHHHRQRAVLDLLPRGVGRRGPRQLPRRTKPPTLHTQPTPRTTTTAASTTRSTSCCSATEPTRPASPTPPPGSTSPTAHVGAADCSAPTPAAFQPTSPSSSATRRQSTPFPTSTRRSNP